jgi:uncharacterized protein YhjY with autotransporter beta-barrel domain
MQPCAVMIRRSKLLKSVANNLIEEIAMYQKKIRNSVAKNVRSVTYIALAATTLISNQTLAYDNALGSSVSSVVTSDVVITNEGTISSNGVALNPTAPSGGVVITNSGTINSSGGLGILSFVSIGTLTNTSTGQITAYEGSILSLGRITNLVNSGLIQSTVENAIFSGAGIDYITNNIGATISSGVAAFDLASSNVISLVNAGSIFATKVGGTANQGNAIFVESTSSIATLTNTGSIDGSSTRYGIRNLGSIVTLNNLQGASALTYSANLPTNYNIIIDSGSTTTTGFGKIAFSSPSGTTTFGISSISGTNIGVAGTRYQNVISGLAASNITNEATTLTYSNGSLTATYQLVADDSNIANTWDLLILSMLSSSGPSATDTQSSIHSLAPKLRGAFSSQTVATNFANMNTYDCNLFDAKGLCVSVGGQQTYVDSPSANMTSAVVVAGYKVSPTLRVGGFLNQNVNSNTGSNVDISNNSPLMGLFAVWNQNENHLGYQVKIANAYQDTDVRTTRDVIGTSEAGRGKTDLNTQSYVGELSYAFLANQDKTLVRPYAAVRYTRIKQDGYTEDATVSTPLTYLALSDRSTAALVGVKLNHKLTDKVNITGSLGVEQDLNHDVDNLTASGVSGLTSENFNNNINRTRPVASIGAYYMPVKNQRIATDIYYQELPFQSTASTTAYLNYMIGF